ncbi:OLC1v1028021C1 [Oldenlandia corymbosa var. corymbosa]|uniref:OLC1v1028021C1 n=1 Tax=Oldenlandia corymbosa var. corymbosa TaxID=529605 RepID=A0AAV1CBX5_OLDCO|nr:OLC1v1028021C1 [Oldenlandia corymbosa var. corymbosa]
MGRSPGKWFKALLSRKKGSKSNLSKGKEISNSSSQGKRTVSDHDETSSLDEVPFSISEPVLISGGKGIPGSEKGGSARLPSIGLLLTTPKQDADAQTATDQDIPEVSESDRLRLEQAATKAQAAFRGYLVRRELPARVDIIRLQAFIRGHLVRRQAVATLYCTQGIVKFQALVRGQNVRRSGLCIQVHNKSAMETKDPKDLKSDQASAYGPPEKIVENAFVAKLLSLSPTVMPLLLQYGPEEPNSASDWLLRWTASRIWEPKSKSEALPTKQQKVETGKAKPKRSGVRLQSVIVENGSNHNSSDQEKQKRLAKKIPSHSAFSDPGHPSNEIEKARKNLKKVSNTTKDMPSEREGITEKQLRIDSKEVNVLPPDLSGDVTDTQSDKLWVETGSGELKTVIPETDTHTPAIEICDHPVLSSCVETELISEGNKDTLGVNDITSDPTGDENLKVSKRRASLPAKHNSYPDAGAHSVLVGKDDQTSYENHKLSKRRASFPAKHDEQDAGLPSETKVPSYMATTESAKAKFRGQVSPRFGQDAYDKNGITRRYSLPSSNNAKMTSSPRVQSLVQATGGRGGIKIDRSLSSSRDGKVLQAEWRR